MPETSLVTACPDCGRRYRVQQKMLGLRVKCRGCSHSFLAKKLSEEDGGAPPGAEEIQALLRDNARLKKRLAELEDSPPTETVTVSMAASIEGLETLTLRIGSDGLVQYVNSPFARHVGVAKESLVGKEATALKRLLPKDICEAILHEDAGLATRIVQDDHGKSYEIRTTPGKGCHDVVIQDVTDEIRYKKYVQKYVSVDLPELSEEDLKTFKYPERRFMTVSFTDMRGFTAMSEALSPEDVRMTINAYIEEITRAIDGNHATVDKIVADEVMALYGAPRYFADHALRAIKTACEQMVNLKALQKSFARFGKVMPDCGIGINTGDMVVGNMGSVNHQDYTVVGSTVNVAARLCGVARGSEIILTETTLKTALAALPEGWEVAAGAGAVEEIVPERYAGKIEGVFPLPEAMRGKVLLLGPGVKADAGRAEYRFRYLHAIKVKGIQQPIPIICVEPYKVRRGTFKLDDEKVLHEPGATIFGKYRLLDFLGRGGMGEVWKARDSFGNIAVIKTLLAGEGASAHQIQRFRREAKIMAKLHHRSICHILEVGEIEKVTYIAMEYIEGVSLAEILTAEEGQSTSPTSDIVGLIHARLERRAAARASNDPPSSRKVVVVRKRATPEGNPDVLRPLPVDPAVGIILRVCDAVAFAHQRGVLHRDIKPANIMLRDDGEPVVMDFGLAKMQAEDSGEMSMSLSGQIVGTFGYMAPEQAESSKDVDARADVYSIGAVLYQMLTGHKHFTPSGNIFDDVVRLKDHKPTSLRQLNPGVEADLELIVLKTLRAEPAERYRSVAELRRDLENYRRGRIIMATAISPLSILVKIVKRNKALSATVAACLVLLAAAASAFVMRLELERVKAVAGMISAEKARQDALKAKTQLEREIQAADLARARAQEAAQARLAGERVARNKGMRAEVAEEDFLRTKAELAVEKEAARKAREESLKAQAEARKMRELYERDLAETHSATRAARYESYSAALLSAQKHLEKGDLKSAASVLAGAESAERHIEWGRLAWLSAAAAPLELPCAGPWALADDGGSLLVAAGGSLRLVATMDGRELGRYPLPDEGSPRVAFSPTGEEILVWNSRGGWLYDRVHDQPLLALPPPGGKPIAACFFCPAKGKLAVSGMDGSLDIYDVARARLNTSCKGGGAAAAAVQILSDWGSVLYKDGVVRVFDARNGAETFSFKTGWGTVESGQFSPGGTRLLVVGPGGVGQIFNVQSGDSVELLSGQLHDAVFLDDQQLVTTATFKGSGFEVRHPRTGKSSPSTGAVESAALSPEGHHLVLRGAAGVELMDLRYLEPLLQLSPSEAPPGAFALAREGAALAVAGPASVKVFLGTRYRQRFFPEPIKEQDSVLPSRDGRRTLVSGPKLLQVFETATGRLLTAIPPEHGAFTVASFSPNGLLACAGRNDGEGLLVAAEDGDVVGKLSGHGKALTLAVFSPRGTWLATAGSDLAVRVHEGRTGKLQIAIEVPERPRGLLFSPAEDRLFVWSKGAGRLFTAPEGKELKLPARKAVASAAFSPNGTKLALGCEDGSLAIADLDGWPTKELVEKRKGEVFNVAFSADGTRLMAVSSEGEVQYFDTHEDRVLQKFRQLGGAPAYSKEAGQWAISVAGGLRLIAASTGNVQQELQLANASPMVALEYSEDGRRLLAAESGGEVRVIDTATGRPLASFKARAPLLGARISSEPPGILCWGKEAVFWPALPWVEKGAAPP